MNQDEKRANQNGIIKKILDGKPDAFEELVELYQGKVYRICFRFMKNEQDAKDMSQEVFIKMYNNLGQYRYKSRFSTWVYALCANTCMDELRKRNRVQIKYEPDFNHLNEAGITPEEVLKSREFMELVESEIDSIEGTGAEVMKRRLFGNQSYKCISNATGVRVSTARTQFSRGRKKLAGIIRNYLKEDS